MTCMAGRRGAPGITASDNLDRIEGAVKSAERFLIVLGVAIILLVLSYKISEKTNYGSAVLVVGVGLVSVLILVEILLIERHRHHR